MPENSGIDRLADHMGQLAQVVRQQIARNQEVRLRTPDTYSGERDVFKLDSWTRSIDRHQTFHGWSEEKTCLFATGYLHGRADHWIRSIEIRAPEEVPTTWIGLKKALIAQFRPTKAIDNARDDLDQLKQVTSVQQYVDAFMDLIMLIPAITEDEACHRFRVGLKNKELQAQLRDISEEQRTLTKFYQHALNYEATRPHTIPNNPRNYQHNYSPPVGGANDPMDLDVMDRNRQKRNDSSSNGPSPGKNAICWYCEKKGHFKRDCLKLKRDNQQRDTSQDQTPSSHHRGVQSSSRGRGQLHVMDNQQQNQENNNYWGCNCGSCAHHQNQAVADTNQTITKNYTNKDVIIDDRRYCSQSSFNKNDSNHGHGVIQKTRNEDKRTNTWEGKDVQTLIDVTSCLKDEARLTELNSAVSSDLPVHTATLQLLVSQEGTSYNSLPVQVLFDSGASECYISPHIANQIVATILPVNREVETAGGVIDSIHHRASFQLNLQGHISDAHAFLYNTKFDIILGRSWLKIYKPQVDWETDSWLLRDESGRTITVHPTTYLDRRKAHGENRQLSLPDHLNYLITPSQAGRLLKQSDTEYGFLYVLDNKSLQKKLEEEGTATPSTKNVSEQWKEQLSAEYSLIFRDTLPPFADNKETTLVQHTINTGSAKPVNRPAYRMSPAELDELRRQLKELLALGLIEPSTSPWGAPVLFVKKKDGEMRMCIDYRGLNKVTIRNSSPLPRIDECLDRLKGASYFTTLDLKSGYHQLHIQPEDMPKTAFNTRYGKFHWKVLPMGLSNSPPFFQNWMNEILKDYIDRTCLVYLDDVCIFSKTLKEHKIHVRQVLDIFAKHKLVVNPKKCLFAQQQLMFLGFQVSAQGILPSPTKVAAINHWPRPTTVQQVRQFIGLSQHYRRFIPGFSTIAAPLTDLTKGVGPKKRSITAWTSNCEESFNKIKLLLTSAPVLQLPDPSLPFIIETDSSEYGVGAVLLQPSQDRVQVLSLEEGEDLKQGDATILVPDDQLWFKRYGKYSTWHPVAYESQKLSAAEQKFPAQERELLGIVHALRAWRCFVDGCHAGYIVYSDHNPLIYFRTQLKPTARLVRWISDLEMFAPTIKYKPGTSNTVADALSRIGNASTPAFTSMEPDYLYTTWDRLPPELQSDWPLLYVTGADTKVQSPKLKTLLVKEKPFFKIEQGKLFREVTLGAGENKYRKWVPFVPFSHRADLVSRFHEGFGHARSKNMIVLLTSRFWWPNMRNDITSWIAPCPSCQINSAKQAKSQEAMHPMPIPHAFQRWHLDFVGELPTTLHGNRWLLTAVDAATNWPIARAVPVASKESVATFIYEEIVTKFGCPHEIVTDRGANFTSGLVDEYVKRLNIKHSLTSAYHPRTNSKVERYNGTIKQMLRKYVAGSIHRWDDFVDVALWASRIWVNSTTGYSPYFLVYGREPTLPGDSNLIPFISRAAWADERTIANVTAEELADLGQHRAAAEARLRAMSEKDKQRWDANIVPISYEVGDLVLVTHEGKVGLEPRFKGPYIVTAIYEDFGTCRLETLEGQPLDSLIHKDRLKKAIGDRPDHVWYDPTSTRRVNREAQSQYPVDTNRPATITAFRETLGDNRKTHSHHTQTSSSVVSAAIESKLQPTEMEEDDQAMLREVQNTLIQADATLIKTSQKTYSIYELYDDISSSEDNHDMDTASVLDEDNQSTKTVDASDTVEDILVDPPPAQHVVSLYDDVSSLSSLEPNDTDLAEAEPVHLATSSSSKKLAEPILLNDNAFSPVILSPTISPTAASPAAISSAIPVVSHRTTDTTVSESSIFPFSFQVEKNRKIRPGTSIGINDGQSRPSGSEGGNVTPESVQDSIDPFEGVPESIKKWNQNKRMKFKPIITKRPIKKQKLNILESVRKLWKKK